MIPVPKPTRIHDEAWLDEIRAMPCCVCVHLNIQQLYVTDPNHTKTKGSGGGDDTAAPMCRLHHDEWHDIGKERFAQKYGIDPREVAKRLWAEKLARAF